MAQNNGDKKNSGTRPSSTNQRSEQPSTYFVQDRSNLDEMTRLQIQDQMLTASMGGVLSEQPDPGSFQAVLDMGCGTGNWLIETARQYPTIQRLVGSDISEKMLEYAQKQATAQGVAERVEFAVMDALGGLKFPTGTFDLVNQRFGASFLRTWEWSKIFNEYRRVCKPGGMIRITEADFLAGTTSQALTQLNDLFLEACYQSGRYFNVNGNNIIAQLPQLLQQSGVENIQTRPYSISYRAGTPEGHDFVQTQILIYQTAVPFLRKWAKVPDDYDKIYKQMRTELQQPDFVAQWDLLTVWGTNSAYVPSSRD